MIQICIDYELVYWLNTASLLTVKLLQKICRTALLVFVNLIQDCMNRACKSDVVSWFFESDALKNLFYNVASCAFYNVLYVSSTTLMFCHFSYETKSCMSQ